MRCRLDVICVGAVVMAWAVTFFFVFDNDSGDWVYTLTQIKSRGQRVNLVINASTLLDVLHVCTCVLAIAACTRIFYNSTGRESARVAGEETGQGGATNPGGTLQEYVCSALRSLFVFLASILLGSTMAVPVFALARAEYTPSWPDWKRICVVFVYMLLNASSRYIIDLDPEEFKEFHKCIYSNCTRVVTWIRGYCTTFGDWIRKRWGNCRRTAQDPYDFDNDEEQSAESSRSSS